MSWTNRYPFYEPARPRAAKGGIKAQSQRGAFGRTWWAVRWNTVLEGFHLGARLGRGRAYARRGQVLDITVEKGGVRARVQGSRDDPYRVTLTVKALSAAQWKRVAQRFAREARFAAKMLAGERPEDIETAFEAASVSLFPERRTDLQTDCSCPDWANPCKHIAAVFYLLGEEFDRDPFLIFTLRGMTREELLGTLGGAAATSRQRGGSLASEAGPDPEPAPPSPEPLTPASGPFWVGESPAEDLFGEVQVPPTAAALLTPLGRFPFWRGAAQPREVLEPVYARAAARALDVFLGLPTHEPPGRG